MIVLRRVKLRAWSRKAPGKKMFRFRKPWLQLIKLPGDMAELHIDFLERWNLSHTGGGKDKIGFYETVAWDNQNPAKPNDPYDAFEINLYFNKKVHILGQNGKKSWYGIVQSERSRSQVYSNRGKGKGAIYFDLGKRSKP